jgi:hypothetical protein
MSSAIVAGAELIIAWHRLKLGLPACVPALALLPWWNRLRRTAKGPI